MKFPAKITPDLAEVIGLHLGDGYLSRTIQGRSQTNVVGFTGHKSEYWYYETFVKPTIEKTFGVTGRIFYRSDNTTRYWINSKDLVSYLAGLGIPIGRKRDASIPEQVIRDGQVLPCVRGVYHAEGSIYRRYSKAYNGHARVYDNLLVIQIRMKLKTLMNQIYGELTNLGLVCNRLTETDGVYTLRITSQQQIAKFLQVIGPKYKTHPH